MSTLIWLHIITWIKKCWVFCENLHNTSCHLFQENTQCRLAVEVTKLVTSFLLAAEVTKFDWHFPAWALSAHSATFVTSEVTICHLKSVSESWTRLGSVQCLLFGASLMRSQITPSPPIIDPYGQRLLQLLRISRCCEYKLWRHNFSKNSKMDQKV